MCTHIHTISKAQGNLGTRTKDLTSCHLSLRREEGDSGWSWKNILRNDRLPQNLGEKRHESTAAVLTPNRMHPENSMQKHTIIQHQTSADTAKESTERDEILSEGESTPLAGISHQRPSRARMGNMAHVVTERACNWTYKQQNYPAERTWNLDVPRGRKTQSICFQQTWKNAWTSLKNRKW